MAQLSIKSSSNVLDFSSLRNSLKSICKTDNKFVVAISLTSLHIDIPNSKKNG